MIGSNRQPRITEHCQNVSYSKGEGLGKSVPCTKGPDHEGPHSFQSDDEQ